MLKSLLDKSFSLSRLGRLWLDGLCAALCEAARTVSYVETVSNKADTLHKAVGLVDERWLKRSYELELRKALKRFGLKRVKLAIDTNKDAYYGEERFYTRGSKFERGTDQVWEYVQLSIVWPIRIPLMALPYPQGKRLADLCIELLGFAQSLPLRIDAVFFDRGFYNAQLIDFLEARRIKYCIFVPKDKAIKRYVEQTTRKIGVYKHTFAYAKAKSVWKPRTTIVVCKEAGTNKKGEPYDMIFATNLKPSFSLVREYKQRWNIETGFRVQNEGKIKTKSNHPLIRLFYFLLRCLLTLLWTLNNTTKTELSYKQYLKAIEQDLKKNQVYKPPSIIPTY